MMTLFSSCAVFAFLCFFLSFVTSRSLPLRPPPHLSPLVPRCPFAHLHSLFSRPAAEQMPSLQPANESRCRGGGWAGGGGHQEASGLELCPRHMALY